jgi:hypothetical protein
MSMHAMYKASGVRVRVSVRVSGTRVTMLARLDVQETITPMYRVLRRKAKGELGVTLLVSYITHFHSDREKYQLRCFTRE